MAHRNRNSCTRSGWRRRSAIWRCCGWIPRRSCHLPTACSKPVQVAGGRENFWPVLQFLSDLTASGGTDLYRCAKEFVANFPSRGIAVVISDFFDEEGARRSMEVLRSAGHDFVILQVHSADEQRPSAFGELMLEEAETGVRRTIECSREKAALYEKAFLEFSEQTCSVWRCAMAGAMRARSPTFPIRISSCKACVADGCWHELAGAESASGAGRYGWRRRALALWLYLHQRPVRRRVSTLALLGRFAAQRLPAPPLAARALGLAGADYCFCCC